MSKTDKNYYTLRDLLQKNYDPMAIRYALLSVHYRQQLNFTLEGLQAGKESMKRIRDFWYERSHGKNQRGSGRLSQLLKKTKEEFSNAMEDDLNTPKALGIIFSFIKEGNLIPKDQIGSSEDKEVDVFFNQLDDIFGIFSRTFFITDIPVEIKKLVEERTKARESKNFELADKLRSQVREKDFILEDTSDGVRVKKLL